jgi:hypothetical protein
MIHNGVDRRPSSMHLILIVKISGFPNTHVVTHKRLAVLGLKHEDKDNDISVHSLRAARTSSIYILVAYQVQPDLRPKTPKPQERQRVASKTGCMQKLGLSHHVSCDQLTSSSPTPRDLPAHR